MITGTFTPKQVCDTVKNSIFDTKKPDSTLFRDVSASQPSSSAKNEKNMTLQRQNSGETDFVTLTHKNVPKIGCFGAFSHYFVFEVRFLRTLKP